MRAFLLMTAIVLAIIPAASDAASHHRTVTRSRPKSRTRRRHSRRRRRASTPRYQLHPTASRYKQIQQALQGKGYYHGKIDGKWGTDSISALQRFQTEQGIENEGKITALALIGLCLGPKHAHAISPLPADDRGEEGDERVDAVAD